VLALYLSRLVCLLVGHDWGAKQRNAADRYMVVVCKRCDLWAIWP